MTNGVFIHEIPGIGHRGENQNDCQVQSLAAKAKQPSFDKKGTCRQEGLFVQVMRESRSFECLFIPCSVHTMMIN